MAIKDIHEVKECPECASMNIVYNDSKEQVICKDCGLIYQPLTPKEEEKYEKASGIFRKVKNFVKSRKNKRKKKKNREKKERKKKKKKK